MYFMSDMKYIIFDDSHERLILINWYLTLLNSSLQR